MQAGHWPDNPSAFKAINLLIHLINGCLIGFISHKLLINKNNYDTKLKYLPFVIASLWLIQPIHISTVLYTVQRMTLLMAFFSLLTLTGYIIGRSYCTDKSHYKGYIICTLSLIFGVVLSTFSKENGVLVIVYISIIELTILHNTKNLHKNWNKWLWLFIYFPIILGTIYFITQIPNYNHGHNIKNYTITEHLLTESRILSEYIGKILLPRPNSFGLFFDDYQISKSLIDPISTLFYSLLSLSAICYSLLFINRKPIFSFSILWYFAGHSLESSVIPVELYFEHRNYLPSFGILFGICVAMLSVYKYIKSIYIKYALTLFFISYYCLVFVIGFNEAKLWTLPRQQSLNWQKEHPFSKRANAYAAQTWVNLNYPLKADEILKKLVKFDSLDSSPHLMRLELNCIIQHLSEKEIDDIHNTLPSTKSDYAAAEAALKLTKRWIKKQCSNISTFEMEYILRSILKNTQRNIVEISLSSTLSLFLAASGQYDKAQTFLDGQLKKKPDTKDYILLKIRWAIANKQYDDALRWIEQNKTNVNKLKLFNINFLNRLNEMEKDIYQLKRNANT